MRAFGIDVSHWEGEIAWQDAAGRIAFAYYKCTDGVTGIDSQFNHNRYGTNYEGIPSAPYHWYHPEQNGLEQANHFIEVANNDGGHYKKYIIDVEEPLPPGMTKYQNWINFRGLLNRVQTLTGTAPMVYTGYYKWLDSMGSQPGVLPFDLILARYTYAKNPTCPYPWKTPKIWQFTDYAFCPGCNEGVGDVDGNWFYGSWQDARLYFGAG